MIECLNLFLLFARFDLLCFGGGYVLVPLLIEQFVQNDGILTMEQFGNLLAIAQVTPGPVGLNSATYVGYVHHGVAGAFSATLGLIVPTLVIGCAATYSLYRWKNHFLVRGILKGTRLAAVSMILYAVTIFLGMSVFRTSIPWGELAGFLMGQGSRIPSDFRISPGGTLICVSTCLLMYKTKLPTTALILMSAAIGMLIC